MHRYKMNLGQFELSEKDNAVDLMHEAMRRSNLSPATVTQTDKGYIIEAWYLTKGAAWLDVVTVTMDIEQSTIKARGIGESTGVLPMTVPLAPILNIFLCWFPFDDWGNNKRYLTHIQRNLQTLTQPSDRRF